MVSVTDDVHVTLTDNFHCNPPPPQINVHVTKPRLDWHNRVIPFWYDGNQYSFMCLTDREHDTTTKLGLAEQGYQPKHVTQKVTSRNTPHQNHL